MAGITRTVHPMFRFKWGPMSALAPDVTLTMNGPEEVLKNGNGKPDEPMGLALFDPDGETHVYVFGPGGKESLIAQLTGGIIVPS